MVRKPKPRYDQNRRNVSSKQHIDKYVSSLFTMYAKYIHSNVLKMKNYHLMYDFSISLMFRKASEAYCCAPYGIDSGPFWIDNVTCVGHESGLQQCDYNSSGINSCRHHDDFYISCIPDNGKDINCTSFNILSVIISA